MDEHTNARTVTGVFEALTRGDREAVSAAFADDVVWHAPGTGRSSGRFEIHLRDGLIVEYWAMNQDQAALDLLMGQGVGQGIGQEIRE